MQDRSAGNRKAISRREARTMRDSDPEPATELLPGRQKREESIRGGSAKIRTNDGAKVVDLI